MHEYTALRLTEKIWKKLRKKGCTKVELLSYHKMRWIISYHNFCPLCHYVAISSNNITLDQETGLDCRICPAIWRHKNCVVGEYTNWTAAKTNEKRSYHAHEVLSAIQRGLYFWNTLKEMNT